MTIYDILRNMPRSAFADPRALFKKPEELIQYFLQEHLPWIDLSAHVAKDAQELLGFVSLVKKHMIQSTSAGKKVRSLYMTCNYLDVEAPELGNIAEICAQLNLTEVAIGFVQVGWAAKADSDLEVVPEVSHPIQADMRIATYRQNKQLGRCTLDNSALMPDYDSDMTCRDIVIPDSLQQAYNSAMLRHRVRIQMTVLPVPQVQSTWLDLSHIRVDDTKSLLGLLRELQSIDPPHLAGIRFVYIKCALLAVNAPEMIQIREAISLLSGVFCSGRDPGVFAIGFEQLSWLTSDPISSDMLQESLPSLSTRELSEGYIHTLSGDDFLHEGKNSTEKVIAMCTRDFEREQANSGKRATFVVKLLPLSASVQEQPAIETLKLAPFYQIIENKIGADAERPIVRANRFVGHFTGYLARVLPQNSLCEDERQSFLNKQERLGLHVHFNFNLLEHLYPSINSSVDFDSHFPLRFNAAALRSLVRLNLACPTLTDTVTANIIDKNLSTWSGNALPAFLPNYSSQEKARDERGLSAYKLGRNAPQVRTAIAVNVNSAVKQSIQANRTLPAGRVYLNKQEGEALAYRALHSWFPDDLYEVLYRTRERAVLDPSPDFTCIPNKGFRANQLETLAHLFLETNNNPFFQLIEVVYQSCDRVEKGLLETMLDHVSAYRWGLNLENLPSNMEFDAASKTLYHVGAKKAKDIFTLNPKLESIENLGIIRSNMFFASLLGVYVSYVPYPSSEIAIAALSAKDIKSCDVPLWTWIGQLILVSHYKDISFRDGEIIGEGDSYLSVPLSNNRHPLVRYLVENTQAYSPFTRIHQDQSLDAGKVERDNLLGRLYLVGDGVLCITSYAICLRIEHQWAFDSYWSPCLSGLPYFYRYSYERILTIRWENIKACYPLPVDQTGYVLEQDASRNSDIACPPVHQDWRTRIAVLVAKSTNFYEFANFLYQQIPIFAVSGYCLPLQILDKHKDGQYSLLYRVVFDDGFYAQYLAPWCEFLDRMQALIRSDLSSRRYLRGDIYGDPSTIVRQFVFADALDAQGRIATLPPLIAERALKHIERALKAGVPFAEQCRSTLAYMGYNPSIFHHRPWLDDFLYSQGYSLYMPGQGIGLARNEVSPNQDSSHQIEGQVLAILNFRTSDQWGTHHSNGSLLTRSLAYLARLSREQRGPADCYLPIFLAYSLSYAMRPGTIGAMTDDVLDIDKLLSDGRIKISRFEIEFAEWLTRWRRSFNDIKQSNSSQNKRDPFFSYSLLDIFRPYVLRKTLFIPDDFLPLDLYSSDVMMQGPISETISGCLSEWESKGFIYTIAGHQSRQASWKNLFMLLNSPEAHAKALAIRAFWITRSTGDYYNDNDVMQGIEGFLHYVGRLRIVPQNPDSVTKLWEVMADIAKKSDLCFRNFWLSSVLIHATLEGSRLYLQDDLSLEHRLRYINPNWSEKARILDDLMTLQGMSADFWPSVIFAALLHANNYVTGPSVDCLRRLCAGPIGAALYAGVLSCNNFALARAVPQDLWLFMPLIKPDTLNRIAFSSAEEQADFFARVRSEVTALIGYEEHLRHLAPWIGNPLLIAPDNVEAHALSMKIARHCQALLMPAEAQDLRVISDVVRRFIDLKGWDLDTDSQSLGGKGISALKEPVVGDTSLLSLASKFISQISSIKSDVGANEDFAALFDEDLIAVIASAELIIERFLLTHEQFLWLASSLVGLPREQTNVFLNCVSEANVPPSKQNFGVLQALREHLPLDNQVRCEQFIPILLAHDLPSDRVAALARKVHWDLNFLKALLACDEAHKNCRLLDWVLRAEIEDPLDIQWVVQFNCPEYLQPLVESGLPCASIANLLGHSEDDAPTRKSKVKLLLDLAVVFLKLTDKPMEFRAWETLYNMPIEEIRAMRSYLMSYEMRHQAFVQAVLPKLDRCALHAFRTKNNPFTYVQRDCAKVLQQVYCKDTGEHLSHEERVNLLSLLNKANAMIAKEPGVTVEGRPTPINNIEHLDKAARWLRDNASAPYLANKIALIMVGWYRATGQKMRYTQQVALAHIAIGGLASMHIEVATGEGKSLLISATNVLRWLGHPKATVDSLTCDVMLAQRDLDISRNFLEMLGIPYSANIIKPYSAIEDYVVCGINFGTPADLTLFHARNGLSGQDIALPGPHCAHLDEEDYILGSDLEYILSSEPSLGWSCALEDLVHICNLIYDYTEDQEAFLSRVNVSLDTDVDNLIHYTALRIASAAQQANLELGVFIDTVLREESDLAMCAAIKMWQAFCNSAGSSLDAEQSRAKIKLSLGQMIIGAAQARSLALNKDYILSENSVVPLVNSRPDPRARFNGYVHAMVGARETKSGRICTLENMQLTVYRSNASNMIIDRIGHNNPYGGGGVLGFSGTTGSPRELEENRSKFGIMTYVIPRFYSDRRTFKPPIIATDAEQAKKHLLKIIQSQSGSHTIYVYLDNPCEALALYAQLRNENLRKPLHLCAASDSDTIDEGALSLTEEPIILVGCPQIARGYDPKKVDVVIAYGHNRTADDTWQLLGRTGRNGKSGHCFRIYNAQNISSFVPSLPTEPRLCVESLEQAVVSRKMNTRQRNNALTAVTHVKSSRLLKLREEEAIAFYNNAEENWYSLLEDRPDSSLQDLQVTLAERLNIETDEVARLAMPVTPPSTVLEQAFVHKPATIAAQDIKHALLAHCQQYRPDGIRELSNVSVLMDFLNDPTERDYRALLSALGWLYLEDGITCRPAVRDHLRHMAVCCAIAGCGQGFLDLLITKQIPIGLYKDVELLCLTGRELRVAQAKRIVEDLTSGPVYWRAGSVNVVDLFLTILADIWVYLTRPRLNDGDVRILHSARDALIEDDWEAFQVVFRTGSGSHHASSALLQMATLFEDANVGSLLHEVNTVRCAGRDSPLSSKLTLDTEQSSYIRCASSKLSDLNSFAGL